MGTSRRSQSFREPQSCYGKLQEPQGRSLEGRLHRALSLRQGREKSRSQGLDEGMEGLEASAHERLPGTLGDTEQLIQTQGRGSQRWLRQYQQVRRRWQSFVASFPGVTLNRPASPEPPLDTNS
ncbi:uncharacterized protein C11orf86 homolog [Nannospalax galili]|uniref:uncharacterized protein C11orf86 homolog n=1 Tax=Nannospalax galili TaxID=1026970 RepID=UPI0004ED45A4|nr:uncharacterized protein C11orf86 homolog [Nannospalax galili]